MRERFDDLWGKYGWTTETSAAMPFWYLTSDGLWSVRSKAGPVTTKGHKPPAEGLLVRGGYAGDFLPDVARLLTSDEARRLAVDTVIESYFPASVRSELRRDLGADWEPVELKTAEAEEKRRSASEQAKFRKPVMEAYEGRCPVCGFGPRDARPPSAIAAAAHLAVGGGWSVRARERAGALPDSPPGPRRLRDGA